MGYWSWLLTAGPYTGSPGFDYLKSENNSKYLVVHNNIPFNSAAFSVMRTATKTAPVTRNYSYVNEAFLKHHTYIKFNVSRQHIL